ncbi:MULTISPECIES: ABC transporter substrate-binding protein [unclassified Pseudonocardia]|uniref:ABC transporter substrate-binding protein n=1 Tax=unclassified Pseudonocardia TaxID=2619320 RepID=UPI001CF6F6AA|nr:MULTISPECIES: ABC transporter substrate-binding protein [unclassified Pseudonocardia]
MRRNSVVLSVGLAAALVASLSACGAAEGNAPAGSTGGDAKKITFIQGVAGDNFYISMQCAAEQEARTLGVSLDTQGPQKFDPTLQTPILSSAIAARPDAIMIAPTDVSAMQQPIDQAIAAGIKVVLVDTTLNDTAKVSSQISSNNLGGGAAAFDAIKQLAPGGGKVLVIDNQPGISTSDARTAGFAEAAKKDAAYTDLGVQYAQNDVAKAAQLVTAALQKDPDIVGVFATNLFGAEGAATGVRQAGKQGAVKIVGFDAGPDQVKALQEGTIQALIAQQPGTIGTDGVQQAVDAIEGKPTEAKIQTDFTIITAQNLDSPASQAAVYKSDCSG